MNPLLYILIAAILLTVAYLLTGCHRLELTPAAGAKTSITVTGFCSVVSSQESE